MIAIVALPVDWKGAATIVQRLADLRRSAWLVNALALLLRTHFLEVFGEAILSGVERAESVMEENNQMCDRTKICKLSFFSFLLLLLLFFQALSKAILYPDISSCFHPNFISELPGMVPNYPANRRE